MDTSYLFVINKIIGISNGNVLNEPTRTAKCDMVVAECALDEAHRRERESEARRVQSRLAVHVGHRELECRRQPRAICAALEHAACVQRKSMGVGTKSDLCCSSSNIVYSY